MPPTDSVTLAVSRCVSRPSFVQVNPQDRQSYLAETYTHAAWQARRILIYLRTDGRHLLTANSNGTAYVLRLPDPFTSIQEATGHVGQLVPSHPTGSAVEHKSP